jgi:nucleoside phosphorylase
MNVNFGVQSSVQGRYDESYESMIRAVTVYRGLVEENPGAYLPDLAKSLNNLGVTLSELGRREEALNVTMEALGIRRRLVEENPGAYLPDLAKSLNNLGSRMSESGQYEESLAVAEEAAQAWRQLTDADPIVFGPDLAASLNNLGNLLLRMGRFDESEYCLREALNIYERSLGADHPHTLTTLMNNAINKQASGRLSEAKIDFQDLLERQSRILGPDHPYTRLTQRALAAIEEHQGPVTDPDLGEDIVADPAPIAVVLTAMQVEYQAVREHLLDIQEQVHPAGTIFHLGRLPNSPWRVVLTQTGQGNLQAAALVERAISHYQPDLVMVVGLAGRLHTDLSLGDVVVAKKVYAIHGGKEDNAGFRPRPRSWSLDHRVVQRAERIAESGTWQDALPDQLPSEATAVVRAIASAEVVLDSADSSHARMIKQHYVDAAAIEMEGAGVALASHPNESRPVVVLRGISDYADEQKDVTDRAGWQQRAARNAAAFAVTLLAELAPTRRSATPRAALEEDLLFGTTDQRIAAVRELGSSRHANAVPLLVRGFDATLDPEVRSRIIWALSDLGTVSARDALRALNPRYDIERLSIRDGLETWPEQPQRQGDAPP